MSINNIAGFLEDQAKKKDKSKIILRKIGKN